MHKSLSSPPARNTESSWSQVLPDLQLNHTLYLVSDINLSVVAKAAAHPKNEELQALEDVRRVNVEHCFVRRPKDCCIDMAQQSY